MKDAPESRGDTAAGHAPSGGARAAGLQPFVIRVAVVAGAIALLFLAWQGRQALMLTFAAVVVAVIFHAAAWPFENWARLPRRWALAAGALAIALAMGLIGWLVGSRIAEQFGELGSALRNAEPTIRGWIGLDASGGGGGDDGSGQNGGNSGGVSLEPYIDWAINATSWGIGAAGALALLVLVIVAGYFLASEPGLYQRGTALMFPKGQQDRVEDALELSGIGLFRWVQGQVISMTIVGMLIGLGAWAIGLPAPIALGLFAGLAAFVPMIGPVVGAAPALALAATEGGAALLWAAGLILVVQQVESNMIMPMVERRTVHIPPALLLLNVFLFGAVFGGVGVIVAAPLTVVVFVLVKKLYVTDALGHSVELPDRP